jgi:hypothetical protein
MSLSKEVLFLLIISIPLGILSAQGSPGGEELALDKFLSKTIYGWEAAAQDNLFDRKTIFDYMNGAGEIYLAYDFRILLVREYTKKSSPPIVAEIYQMSSSEDAYGVFSQDPDGEEVDLGQGALYGMGLLRFWKGKIFVRILAEKETAESKAAVMALGKKIAEAIPDKGKKPVLLDWIPSEGLHTKLIPYFHKPVILNIHFYLGDTNILNLNEKTEAVLARYRGNQSRVRLLLCRYAGAGEAREGFKRFSETYFSGRPKGSFRAEDTGKGGFVSAQVVDRVLILIFEASDKETCRRLTEAVAKRIKGGSK